MKNNARILAFINGLEESKFSFGAWFGSALSIIYLRNIIENALCLRSIDRLSAFNLIHFPVFFISVLLALSIVLHLFSKVEIIKVTRLSLFFLGVIVLPPLIDAFIFGSHLESYRYIMANVRFSFINFLNPFVKIDGISYGIRLEIIIVSLFSLFYILIKGKGILRSLLCTAIVYCTCFCYIAIPALLAGFSGRLCRIFGFRPVSQCNLTFMFRKGELAARQVDILGLLFLSLLAGLWFLRYDSNKFKASLSNIRASRSLHYILLALVGFSAQVAINPAVFISTFAFIKLLGIICAIFFAFQFSVIVNDAYDVECDRVSNKDRPLVVGSIARDEYLKISLVLLLFSLLFAFKVNDTSFMIILGFIALYFIYSAPPLRLKRFFPVSIIIIALEAVAAFLLGYGLPLNESLSINNNLTMMSGPLFFIFLLSSSVKDLKDVQGDRACGVSTLPVLLGEVRAARLIGLLVCISYMSVPIFLSRVYFLKVSPALFICAFFLGLFNYFFIAANAAKEKVIFYSYFLYVCCIFIFVKPV